MFLFDEGKRMEMNHPEANYGISKPEGKEKRGDMTGSISFWRGKNIYFLKNAPLVPI